MHQDLHLELQRLSQPIGKKIKQRKYPIERLSNETGLSKRIIYNILKGKDNYTLKSLIVLTSHLGLSLTYKRRTKLEVKIKIQGQKKEG
jgi:hypothetical protein